VSSDESEKETLCRPSLGLEFQRRCFFSVGVGLPRLMGETIDLEGNWMVVVSCGLAIASQSLPREGTSSVVAMIKPVAVRGL